MGPEDFNILSTNEHNVLLFQELSEEMIRKILPRTDIFDFFPSVGEDLLGELVCMIGLAIVVMNFLTYFFNKQIRTLLRMSSAPSAFRFIPTINE